MDQEATREVLKGFLDPFNNHDLDAIMGYFADDCVFFMPRGTKPRGDQYVGKRGVDLLELDQVGKITRKDSFWKILE